MKLNELNLNHVLGDYGAAAVKQVGNRIAGNAEGSLSVQDKIAKEKFISNFIGRANTSLNSAIQSGLVDPKAKQAAQAAVRNPNAKPKPKLATNQPKTPAEIQKEKLAAAAKVAQQQMANSPAPTKPGAPQATQTAQGQMASPQSYQSSDPRFPNGKYDGVTGKPTPEYQAELDKQEAASAEKQKADAAASQAQAKSNDDMAANMNNIAAQRNIPNVTQATTPNVSTGADAEQAALDKMHQKNPKLAGMMAQAGMDANGNDKMTPQQVAALKGKLKAGAAPTSGQSGFKDYVGGSGERMTGVDKSGAPVFKTLNRESKYAKLDYILESIINVDEAKAVQSISEYLQNMFNQYIKVTDPKVQAQIKKLADQAQATYGQDKGKAALTQMGNLAFASSNSQGSGATQGAGATASQPQSALSSFASGFKQGAGGTASEPASASATTGTQGGSVYDQVMSLVGKLSSEEKKQLIATLQEPASGGAGAFDQMGKQLQQPKTTANPVNRQQKLNTNKVKAGNKGAPTPDEQSKFDNLVKQKLANQP